MNESAELSKPVAKQAGRETGNEAAPKKVEAESAQSKTATVSTGDAAVVQPKPSADGKSAAQSGEIAKQEAREKGNDVVPKKADAESAQHKTATESATSASPVVPSKPATDGKPVAQSGDKPPATSEAGTASAPVVTPEQERPASAHELTAHKEDYLLWGLIAAVLAFVAMFFWRYTNDALEKLTLVPCTTSVELCASEQRFALAATSLKVITLRSNSAFLIGTLVCLIGCTIVLRRVRVMFEGEGGPPNVRTRIATDSPGLLIAILGAAILLATVLARSTVELHQGYDSAGQQSQKLDANTLEKRAEQALRDYEIRANERRQGQSNDAPALQGEKMDASHLEESAEQKLKSYEERARARNQGADK